MSHFNKPDSFAPKRIGSLQLDGADKLVSQLSFIKQHLRYPMDRQKILAFVGLLITFPFPLVLWILLKRNPNLPFPLWMWPLMAMLFVPAIAGLIRFLRTFKFISIKSRFSAFENEQLLTQFFQAAQLRMHRHPETKELFWIMSQPIYRKSETREVVVFIVEDRRILINSHFTRPQFIPHIGRPHHLELAKALKKWLDSAQANTTELVHL